jgi:hypothetical protein
LCSCVAMQTSTISILTSSLSVVTIMISNAFYLVRGQKLLCSISQTTSQRWM